MVTASETRPTSAYTPVQEDEALHNSLIKERYERLKNAEATQLAESISAAERTPYEEPRAAAPVIAPERPERQANYSAFSAPPVREEQPLTGTFVHTKVDSPLFTPETLDRTIQENYYDFAPIQTPAEFAAFQPADMQAGAAVTEMPVSAVNVAETEAQESYGLSTLAMKAIAAFAAVVITLLSVIGINSYVIRKKTNQLKKLEQQRSRLEDETDELERRIEEAKSYEKLLQFVEENGWISAEP